VVSRSVRCLRAQPEFKGRCVMDKHTFAHTTKLAIGEGHAARQSLANHQAHYFLNNHAHFDPRVLQRLGSAGLTTFLRTLQTQGIAVDQPSLSTIPQRRDASSTLSTTRGWADQRRKEPAWWLRAIMRGTLTGLGLVLAGTLSFIICR
jgi:hypothetical protein